MATAGRLNDIRTRRLGFARRHVPRALRLAGLIGVPVAVILGSGGWHTIVFWIMAAVLVPATLVGILPVGMVLLLVAAPIFWLLKKLMPGRVNSIVENAAMVFWVVLTVATYVLGADLGEVTDIRLPTPWPNVGALIVMTAASVTSMGLIRLGRRLDEPQTIPTLPGISPTPPAGPEPEEEFWSDQHAVGWRSWTWDGTNLRGVWKVWHSEEFEALCDECGAAPTWGHTCGIYAVKNPDGVFRFQQRTPVVGRVEMWGNVIEHTNGYRASHARITDVWVPTHLMAHQIAARYRVNVEVGSPQLSVRS